MQTINNSCYDNITESLSVSLGDTHGQIGSLSNQILECKDTQNKQSDDYQNAKQAHRYNQSNGQVQVLFGKDLEGNLLLDQFLVTKKLGKGSFGDVYEVMDITQVNQAIPLVLKISKDFHIMGKEIQALRAFQRRHEAESMSSGAYKTVAEYIKAEAVPQVLSYGMFTQLSGKTDSLSSENVQQDLNQSQMALNEEIYSFYIMPKYGPDVDQYFHRMKKDLSTKSILHLSMEILKMLEKVHSSGYIYGDLKLDNVLIGEGQTLPNQDNNPDSNVFEQTQFHLIDFGFSTRFQDKDTGEHFEQVDTEVFQGNLIFSSLNQLNFKSTSRRDDLISLAYMMSLMLQKGQLPGINPQAPLTQVESYNTILNAKNTMTTADLCSGNDSEHLASFFDEIFQLQFKQKPDYAGLLRKLQNFYKELDSQKLVQYNSLDDTIDFLHPKRQMSGLTLATYELSDDSEFEGRYKVCSSKYSCSDESSSESSRQSPKMRPNKIITKKHKFTTMADSIKKSAKNPKIINSLKPRMSMTKY